MTNIYFENVCCLSEGGPSREFAEIRHFVYRARFCSCYGWFLWSCLRRIHFMMSCSRRRKLGHSTKNLCQIYFHFSMGILRWFCLCCCLFGCWLSGLSWTSCSKLPVFWILITVAYGETLARLAPSSLYHFGPLHSLIIFDCSLLLQFWIDLNLCFYLIYFNY